MSSPRIAFKALYRTPQLLLYVSIPYKNGDSDTTEAYNFTHCHLKVGQISLLTSRTISQGKLVFSGGVVTTDFIEDLRIPVFQWLNSGQESLQLSNKCISSRKAFERRVSGRVPAISTAPTSPLGGGQ